MNLELNMVCDKMQDERGEIDMAFCPNCGMQLIDGANFCVNCGIQLNNILSNNDTGCKRVFMSMNDIVSYDEILDKIYQSEYGDKIRMTKKLREISSMELKDASETVERYLSLIDKTTCTVCKKKLRIEKKQVGIDSLGNKVTKKIGYCDQCKSAIYIEENQTAVQKIKLQQKRFNGIYRYTMFGEKKEVYCPRCKSENCSHYKEQKIIPGKVKAKYTANLNPLKPFTLVNKEEKMVKKDQVITENKFICNSCGKIFL
ncbi:MAG: zinc ribbon domain-containing protein [Lachnospiraceae bacterium]|nr:zinc ribbon domain-containing protein [Lachnospiraceae bacterium]